jgi:hypothetical protein
MVYLKLPYGREYVVVEIDYYNLWVVHPVELRFEDYKNGAVKILKRGVYYPNIGRSILGFNDEAINKYNE